MNPEDYRYARRVTIVGLIANIVIAAVKLSLGLIGKSAVLVAEAVDSLLDVAATSGVLIGLKFASTPKDDSHPHGHGKIESIVALLIGIAIGITGIFLIYQNASRIYYKEYLRPEWIALTGVALSIAIKAGLYRYTLKASIELNSPAIRANALDHKADIYRLSGVFFGLLFAITGYPILDPIAAIIVALFIIKTSFEISRDSIQDLIDVQMPEQLRKKIDQVITDWNPEYQLVETIGRRMGGKYQVNLKVRVGPYVQALDGVSDLKQLEEYIRKNIPSIQGVDITADVDTADIAVQEKKFKDCVHKTLDKHADRYRSIESMEFHFLQNQQEVHFNMIVDPEMSVDDAHEITCLIEQEICSEFQNAQVIIHIEPAGK